MTTVLIEEWDCDLPKGEAEGRAADPVLSLSLGALPTASPLLGEQLRVDPRQNPSI